MGFFKDFKRDFAQAVNELMPDQDELGGQYDDEDMVNTFDEADLMEVAPEDLLEDLDDIRIDHEPVFSQPEKKVEAETEQENTEEKEEQSLFDTVPDAEIIQDEEQEMLSEFAEEQPVQPEPEILEAEKVEEFQTEAVAQEDELVLLEELDEVNMMEGLEDAELAEAQAQITMTESAMEDLDIGQAVEDTMAKQNHASDAQAEEKQVKQNKDVLTVDTTYIAKSMTIQGDIQSEGSIDVIGTIVGNVSCDAKLVVGGKITGAVNVGELYTNAAKIDGEVHVKDSAKIGVGSVIVGNVYAGSAVIAGAVKGDIDVKGPVIVDSTAVIMGNIKSKSVQINNGAVIEGMCSQCYSDIDVGSFFE